MLIIGAKGFAKEVLEVIYRLDANADVHFYDDVNLDIADRLFEKFPILKSTEAVVKYQNASKDMSFTIGIGNPILRKKLYKKFSGLGGIFTSVISPNAIIGKFDNEIMEGCNIMSGVIITSSVKIGMGCLVNLNTTIGHDCSIGDFVELSPNVNISGNCSIGSYSTLGTSATVLPKINIGRNVIIGAGSVVTRDIPDNSIAYGIPAKVIRNVEPISEE